MARLTFVQYAGDFREAVQRFDAGGPETYRAQRYSVGQLGTFAQQLDEVTIICGVTDGVYDERLSNGVRAIGLGCQEVVPPAAFIPVLEQLAPTHLAVMTPLTRVLAWAARRRVDTIAVLADSFGGNDLRSRVRHWLLAHALNAPNVSWVGNHALNSCLSLMAIGVDSHRIIPWDWPPAADPREAVPRTRGSQPFRLLYVGAVVEAKGVGDLVDAMHIVRLGGNDVTLTIVGEDHGGAMAARVHERGLEDVIRLTGRIANEAVTTEMIAADAVVVPSRHDYAEGLPMVIYEALSVRTPLIASDHPMFRGAIRDAESAIIFRASDPQALAEAVIRLASDDILYADLSSNAAAAWHALQLPVLWGELLQRWISGKGEDRAWLANHTIASGIYNDMLTQRRIALGVKPV